MTDRPPAFRLFVTDVDGTLTDGQIVLGTDGRETKRFHAHDGYALKLLPKLGILATVVSGRRSEVVRRRLEDLGIEHAFLGANDKVAAVESLIDIAGCRWNQVAYVGDDLSDLPVMLRAGFSACPADAAEDVRSRVHHVTQRRGGEGAVREAIEILLKDMGRWDEVLRQHGVGEEAPA